MTKREKRKKNPTVWFIRKDSFLHDRGTGEFVRGTTETGDGYTIPHVPRTCAYVRTVQQLQCFATARWRTYTRSGGSPTQDGCRMEHERDVRGCGIGMVGGGTHRKQGTWRAVMVGGGWMSGGERERAVK